MKKQKTKQRISTGEGTQPIGSLGAVFQQAGFAPSQTTTEPNASDPAPLQTSPAPASSNSADLRRARFRREKKGRGGKTVTLVENLTLDDARLNALLKRLKTALGCGGIVEENTIILQGDIVDRVQKWFRQNR